MCITNLDIVFGQILNIENLLKNNILMCVLTYLPHKGLLFLEIKISNFTTKFQKTPAMWLSKITLNSKKN